MATFVIARHQKVTIEDEFFFFCSVQPFTTIEVEMTLKQMEALKAPGSDGLPALFFQKYWDIVGKEASHLVLDVLNSRKDPNDLNRTLITLIPKDKVPENFSQYRPISLCNVIMKLVTKTIANRLKMMLPNLINENQSAFVTHHR